MDIAWVGSLFGEYFPPSEMVIEHLSNVFLVAFISLRSVDLS